MKDYKIAFLTFQPIIDQVSIFQKLAAHPDVDLTVYFCLDAGVNKPEFNKEFNVAIKWDVPLLNGYKYKFLKNFSPKPSSSFWGQINPGIILHLWRNRHTYNLLFVHGWNSISNWIAFVSAILFRIPIGIHGDNCFMCEAVKPKWKRAVKKVILSTLFRAPAAFFYMGKEDKKFYQHHGVNEERLFFMPYATDNDRFINLANDLKRERSDLKRSLGIHPEQAVILFCGKLVDRKRPLDLLKAFHILTARYFGGKKKTARPALVFVGDGVLRPHLEEYMRVNNLEDVYFVGFKNLSEIPQFYSIADVFVMPSFNECWGIVVNEAMCFSLPIIASDSVGSVPDLVKDGENGFVYPLGDADALSEHLYDIVTGVRKRELFGRRSLEIVRGYSHENNIAVILKFVRND